MTNEKMRADFEAHCKKKNPAYKPSDDGVYERRDWAIWQAATIKACKGRMMAADKNKTFSYLHVYPQYTHHAELQIKGTLDGLQKLVAAIQEAIDDSQSFDGAVFANDGEGYQIIVTKADGKDDLGEPYYAHNHEGDCAAQWQDRAFKAEAECSRLKKELKAATQGGNES